MVRNWLIEQISLLVMLYNILHFFASNFNTSMIITLYKYNNEIEDSFF